MITWDIRGVLPNCVFAAHGTNCINGTALEYYLSKACNSDRRPENSGFHFGRIIHLVSFYIIPIKLFPICIKFLSFRRSNPGTHSSLCRVIKTLSHISGESSRSIFASRLLHCRLYGIADALYLFTGCVPRRNCPAGAHDFPSATESQLRERPLTLWLSSPQTL
jgi:hypothetical protein